LSTWKEALTPSNVTAVVPTVVATNRDNRTHRALGRRESCHNFCGCYLGQQHSLGAELRDYARVTIFILPHAQVVAVREQRQRLRPCRGLGWMFAAAAAVILVVGAVTSTYVGTRSGRGQVFSEIADLHVATLASSSPVDVISTDRHTVKPWFQGKIPFAFDLPELQNSDFSLLGGRMTYLDQTPGAHLIYDVRKHHISVFVFQERSLPAGLDDNFFAPKKLSFNMETWSQGGLRYFVIGDASAADIDSLAKLFKAAS
jgi:anti-sigma factor RsiW